MWYSRYTRWPASSLPYSTGASTRPKTDESISATQDPGISVRTGTDVSPILTSMVLIVPSSYRQDTIVPSVLRLGPEESTTRYPHSNTRSEPASHIAQGKRRCDRPYAIRYRLSRTSPLIGPRREAGIGRTGYDKGLDDCGVGPVGRMIRSSRMIFAHENEKRCWQSLGHQL
jgi:hypothetical protein